MGARGSLPAGNRTDMTQSPRRRALGCDIVGAARRRVAGGLDKSACWGSQVPDLVGVLPSPSTVIWGFDSSTLDFVTHLSSDRVQDSNVLSKKKRTGKRTQMHIFTSASLGKEGRDSGGLAGDGLFFEPLR